MSKDCDCYIGELCGDDVRLSTILSEINSVINTQKNFKSMNLLNGDVKTKSQIVDNRRGFLSRFNFCPFCGIKIDWKQILKDL